MKAFRVLCVAGLALASCAALAGERIHFKNGHLLEVKASRVDGQTLVLTLPEGAEISVPLNLVEDVEGGREVTGPSMPLNYSGRGLLLTELNGYKRLGTPGQPLLGGASGLHMSSGAQPQSNNFGFSSNGSGDIANRGTPGAMVRATSSDDGSAFNVRPGLSDAFAARPGAIQQTGQRPAGALKVQQVTSPDDRLAL